MTPAISQLCFDFLDTARPAAAVKHRVTKQPKRVKFAPAPTIARDEKPAEPVNFRAFCVLLHDLAQKNTARTNVRDFAQLVHCTRLLRDAGLPIEPLPGLNAHVVNHAKLLVRHDPHYRKMRDSALAGLATLADLNTKAPGKGSPDYQRGMRDAFQKASEIAALFLEDFLADTQKENEV